MLKSNNKLKKVNIIAILVVFIFIFSATITSIYAHSGKLDSLGGHNVNKEGTGYEVGTYHYHSGQYAGWIVSKKGDIPDPEKDTFDSSLITDGSTPIITPTPTPTETPTSTELTYLFSDLNSDHWAYDSVKSMVDKKIIDGFPDGTFRPSDVFTREQFAKILSVGLKLDNVEHESNTFEDVISDRWSYQYIENVKNYLTYYLDNNKKLFKPEESAKREDVIVAIVKVLNLDLSTADEVNLEEIFSDYNDISEGNENYIAVAYKNDLLKGYPDGTLQPQGSLTRAEAVTFLDRILE